MALVLSGSIDISGSMTATTIVVSTPGAAGMVSSSAQITELAPLMAYTASIKAASIVSSSQQIQNYNTFAVTSSANTFYGAQSITGSLRVTGSLKVGDWVHGEGVANNAKLDIRTAPDRGIKITGNVSSDVIITAYRGATDDLVRGMRLEGNGIGIYIGDGNANTGSSVASFNTNGLAFEAGKGIDFSATANSGSTTPSELLNDYEEGTWIPTISFGGASVGVTYDSSQPNYNKGTYTKVGRQVTAIGYLVLSSKGSSTGDANINGLPFVNLSGTYCPVSFAEWSSISFADVFHGYTSGTSIVLEETTNAGTLTRLTDANFQSNSGTLFTLTYFV